MSRTLFVIVMFVTETVEAGMRSGAFRKVNPLLLHISILAPMMVHLAGTSFRPRLITKEMPGVPIPTNEDMLAHLLEGLDRPLAPADPGRIL